jgi:hypothetical protein
MKLTYTASRFWHRHPPQPQLTHTAPHILCQKLPAESSSMSESCGSLATNPQKGLTYDDCSLRHHECRHMCCCNTLYCLCGLKGEPWTPSGKCVVFLRGSAQGWQLQRERRITGRHRHAAASATTGPPGSTPVAILQHIPTRHCSETPPHPHSVKVCVHPL